MAALARTHGVDLIPHQTQPTVGHQANLHFVAAQLHAHYPCEYDDRSGIRDVVFANPPRPVDGRFILTDAPGLGLELIEDELSTRMRLWKSG
jgi:L-alanine-DL-glutamate epimerase-like enolase superfamily enzyme